MTGPNFICVGAIKGGTTWLYDQCRLHPDVWMPPIKEIHYFNRAWRRSFPPPRFLHMAERARALHPDPRTVAFFDAMRVCDGLAVDIALYSLMFMPKGNKLSGDVSPGYDRLPPPVIAQIACDLPHTKVVFMARDPVERAWSHLSMRHRQGGIGARVIESETALRAFLECQDMREASFASRIIARWAQAFGPDRFRVFDFEDTARDAVRQRHDIFSFIGLDPSKKSGPLAESYNAKEGRAKLTLTPEIRGWLETHFAAEREAWAALKASPLKSHLHANSAEILAA